VKIHLYKKGFVLDYWFSTSHKEVNPTHFGEGTSFDMGNDSSTSERAMYENEVGGYVNYVIEGMLSDAFKYEENTMMDDSNLNAELFYNMLKLAQQPLYE